MYDPVSGSNYIWLFVFAFLGGLLIYGALEFYIMPEIKKWKAEKERLSGLKWKQYKRFRRHILDALGANGNKRESLLKQSRADYLDFDLPAKICEPLYEQKDIDNESIMETKRRLDEYMVENYGRER